MTCKVAIYTEGGYVWRCPRPAVSFGYCKHHLPRGLYRIRFTWPDGKVRWCCGESLTSDPQQARLYTFEEAQDAVVNQYKDARLVWGIVTTKEHVR